MKGRWMLVLVAAATVLGGVRRARPEEAAPAAPAESPPAESAPAAGDERPLGEEDAMVLNFERADIREVIHSLATALGLSYTIDPRIEGQVTIRTTGKIAREDLFPLFNQILRNNGIAAVKVGDLYQILPVSEAKTRAIIPKAAAVREAARQDDGFVIEIVPVKHVSSDEMTNILQPFLTPGGDVMSYPRANLVVITDLQSNVERLRGLLATFDTDTFRNLHARVYKMKYGDPDQLANELLGILAPYGVTPTGEGEGGTYLVPLQRLNAIVVIAYDEGVFDEVDRWLRVLDIPPDEEFGRQTFVYSVENAKAADLADVLNQLFGGGPGGPGGLGVNPAGTPGGVGLFGAGGVSGGAGRGGGGFGGQRPGGFGGGPTGGLGGGIGQQAGGGMGGGSTLGGGGTSLGGGGAGGLGGGTQLGGRGGAGGARQPGAPGAPGQPGQAAHAVSLPGGFQAQGAGGPGTLGAPPPVFKQEVRIVADDVTNSLVVLATKRDYNLILDVLKRIDIVARQVVLEVTIAEITLNNSLQFGVGYALAQGQLLGSAQRNNTNIFDNSTRRNVTGLFADPSTVPVAAGQAFAVLTDNNHFQMFLNALQSITHVKMLSAPHIIAADNREAHILVGSSIPILTGTSTFATVGTTPAVANSVQYRDTGKILTVLPQVNSKGLVNLQIRQEVSDVASPNFGATGSPSFTTREAETTLVVQDGETALIGGIIDDKVTNTRSGVPFLMNIPVIGVIFRNDNNEIDRTELIVTITPYVMRNREETRKVTDEFSDRISGFRHLQKALRPRPRPMILVPQEGPAPGGPP